MYGTVGNRIKKKELDFCNHREIVQRKGKRSWRSLYDRSYEFILGFFCRYMIRHYNMYIIKIIIYKREARALTERVRRKLECSFP